MNSDSRKIKNFTDLDVWKEGHKLVLEIYRLTKPFPKEELFGLVSQMRRCAVSITSNVAEGFSRQTYKDKVHFYIISQGSITELQNQLIISKDVRLIDDTDFQTIYTQSITVHKILAGLIRASKNNY